MVDSGHPKGIWMQQVPNINACFHLHKDRSFRDGLINIKEHEASHMDFRNDLAQTKIGTGIDEIWVSNFHSQRYLDIKVALKRCCLLLTRLHVKYKWGQFNSYRLLNLAYKNQ